MTQPRQVTSELGKDRVDAPSLLDISRLRTLYALGWGYLVQSFNKEDRFCMETVHKDENSRDAELRAIYTIGRKAVVVDLKEYLGGE